MARLIFVRHSIPAIDPERPSKDWELSPQGRDAARTLAVRLAQFDIATIVSSDEPKARQTAEALADHLNLPLHLDPDLREHERAAMGFLARPAFEDAIAGLFAQPQDIVFGGESADQVFTRMERAMERAQRLGGGDLAIVSHGTALTLYIARLAGLDPMPFWKSLTMPMAIVMAEGGIVTIRA